MASSSQHPSDSHDLIRVQGARVNNLKDVSVAIPKRRLTVFTGLYLFVLPYAAKWRSGRRTDSSPAVDTR